MVDYEEELACCVMHVRWPSAADPFYQHNPLPVTQRIEDYYGITWVPDLMINGAGAGYPGGPDPESYESMAAFIDSCASVSSPLAIEIPGCMCHSDDPDVVAEHEQYRMNQCAGCHMGGTLGG